MKPTYLNSVEAASYVQERGLPCSPNTLKKLRSVGGGPEFQSWGSRVVYAADALDNWIDHRLSAPRRNTADFNR